MVGNISRDPLTFNIIELVHVTYNPYFNLGRGHREVNEFDTYPYPLVVFNR